MEPQVFVVHYRQKEKLPEPFLARLFEQFRPYTFQKSISHRSDGTILMHSVIANKGVQDHRLTFLIFENGL